MPLKIQIYALTQLQRKMIQSDQKESITSPCGTSKYYYQDENVWNIINLSAPVLNTQCTLQNTTT
jgi:hypothetical protein